MKLPKTKKAIVTGIAIAAIATSGAAYAATGLPFTDIQGKWYQNTVAKAFERGLVNGVGQNKYEGDRVFTRGEAAALANNIYDKNEVKINALESEISDLKGQIAALKAQQGTTTIETPAPTQTSSNVTLANYDKIEVGKTTKAQVEALFGTKGTVQTSSSFDGHVSEMIEYSAGEFASATISYENGVVDYKSQANLK